MIDKEELSELELIELKKLVLERKKEQLEEELKEIEIEFKGLG